MIALSAVTTVAVAAAVAVAMADIYNDVVVFSISNLSLLVVMVVSCDEVA
jgi:hypothetical protein